MKKAALYMVPGDQHIWVKYEDGTTETLPLPPVCEHCGGTGRA